MTQEEKAKAYDKAIKVINDNLGALNEIVETGAEVVNIQSIQNCFYKAFPELKESNDERIRKEILNYIDKATGCKRWVAWLEKLDESSDKAELRFHEGDWIVHELTGSVYQIKNCIENVTNHKYGYDLTDGDYIGSGVVNQYHLWTIKDAKNGDILCTGNGNLFIFKGIKNDVIYDYCGLYNNTFYPYSGSPNGIMACSSYNDYKPASKEQRELLFKKMKELGYEWDVEKKESKKIEQNPDQSDEIEILMLDTISNLTELKDIYGEEYGNVGKCIDWLNSIKDRIQLKPHQEWTEEDEKKIKGLIKGLEDRMGFGWASDPFSREEYINWLKSIIPENRWKPSGKQMEILSVYANVNDVLASLYLDLKKLND